MNSQPTPYDLVRTHLLQADPRVVYRILHRHVADVLDLKPRIALETLVTAMFRGDVILHWEIVCPVCSARGEQHDWLRHARHDVTCKNCQTTFAVHLDSEAQTSFSPHPKLRRLTPGADDPDFLKALRDQYPPATVHELMMIQDFRDWAREQPLPPGEHLEVKHMVIWFSDLAGSTAMYAQSGDPHAYELVRQHFDLVFEAVQRAEGAIVKTTGDGVMAAFISMGEALQAAQNAHRMMDDFNQQRAPSEHLLLKIGIHAGPSIAVTLNERLDYFGTTVNVAARVSDLARGGETIVTEPAFTELGPASDVDVSGAEAFQTPIRGLERTLDAYRIRK